MSSTEYPVYQVGFDSAGVLVVNGQPLTTVEGSVDDRLDWALNQVSVMHRSLPDKTPLRVEVDDQARDGGYGATGVLVPHGVTLTGDMVRQRLGVRRGVPHDSPGTTQGQVPAAPAPVPRASAPSPQVPNRPAASPEHVVQSPVRHQRSDVVQPPVADAVIEQRQKVAPPAVYASDKRLMPYTPKEDLPRLRKRRSDHDAPGKPPMSTGTKTLLVLVVLALVGGLWFMKSRSTGPSYAQVCVHNLSLQRLSSDSCGTGKDQTSRWWWVRPGAAVPAVGGYVDAHTGTFKAPTGKEAAVDRSVSVNGRPASTK